MLPASPRLRAGEPAADAGGTSSAVPVESLQAEAFLVEVEQPDGTAVSGRLVRIDGSDVTVEVSGEPRVLPIGGARPALGTNPLCFGFPSKEGPVIFDMGTASLMWGDVMLHAHLGQPLPEGIGFDEKGLPTTDAASALRGGVVPFGGYKGFGLSFAVQALGLLAGATFARGTPQDYGFLFWVVDPAIMFTEPDFESQMSDLVAKIKATPKQPGVDEIRIPSERARREREQRRVEGIVVERKVIASLEAL